MRAPPPVLVVDAAVLISAVFGRSAGIIAKVRRAAILVTTDRVLAEARRRIELGLNRPDLLALLDELADALTVVPVADLDMLLDDAAASLRDAVASRNGSTRDAHVLALAWNIDADVWTTDRDFAGAGVATWSTPNLMRGLGQAARDGEP
ncbi:PIN domain-containing protein [Oleomonas cavernae]|uniref:Ribonuclease VapC n=1 Tax=Oleomonas cavernae TaxID=2320859 RepID=A0A418W9Z2_9PROT|nr:PIN domain-containing protein [Oleomonas cavernae]RJF86830.1 PIN domain-containing protein [Oleomonas cavernae]